MRHTIVLMNESYRRLVASSILPAIALVPPDVSLLLRLGRISGENSKLLFRKCNLDVRIFLAAESISNIRLQFER